MTNVFMRRERTTEVNEERLKTKRIAHGEVLSLDDFGRQLLQGVNRFVGEPRTGEHADGIVAMLADGLVDVLSNEANRFVPGRRNQSPAFLIANQRRANSFFVIDEWMAEAPFYAEKLTVVAVQVSITRDDPYQIISARAERHLTTVRTIGARGNRLR